MYEVKYIFKVIKEWEKASTSLNHFIDKQGRKVDVETRHPEIKTLKNSLIDGLMILWEYVKMNPQIFDKEHVHEFWEKVDKK